MKYKLIVFDWDGTLYDSGAYIVSCMQQAAKDAGLEVPEVSAIKNVIGLSFEEALKVVMPDLSHENKAVFVKMFRDYIRDGDNAKPVFFPGSEDVLQQLLDADYWLAIATGKSRKGLNMDLAELNANKYFMTTRCADETLSKPHPQMLLEIIDELGVDPKQTLMIGDTGYDLDLAKNAKVDALAVDYGMHERARLLKYDIKGCLSNIKELPAWLAR